MKKCLYSNMYVSLYTCEVLMSSCMHIILQGNLHKNIVCTMFVLSENISQLFHLATLDIDDL